MKPLKVQKNPHFMGRKIELDRLWQIQNIKEAALIVVYGRRRIGKTELIEQFYRSQGSPIIKFEGIEEDKHRPTNQKARLYQMSECLRRLSIYLEDPHIAKMLLHTWSEFFELLDPLVRKQKLILYFEEIQWLSNYSSDFLASMKPFWDDSWRHNKNLRIVVCGSSPSFIVQEFISDKALYGRSTHEFHLKEFNLMETREFLGGEKIGPREAMTATLTVGGIPEYLKLLKAGTSVFSSLCEHSFKPSSFFLVEKEKIFVSSLSHTKHYRNIVQYLSKQRYATREEIARGIKVKTGGYFSNLLEDLTKCGFIEEYTPLHLKDDSKLARYCIDDEYLRFYYNFIHPIKNNIENGNYTKDVTKAINKQRFAILQGYAFEKWCRKHHSLFAKIMKFDQIEYRAGSFFNQKIMSSTDDRGFQIDLMYIRTDSKIVICEIKYYGTTRDIAHELLYKIDLFKKVLTEYKNYTFETALITAEESKNRQGNDESIDHFITFDDIFNKNYWI